MTLQVLDDVGNCVANTLRLRLVQSASLTVTDTFGVKTLLQPAGANGSARWGLFRHAMPVDSDEAEGVPISNLLYLAPRVAQPLIGPVVEQVTLTRDEQANIAWAIEQILESPLQVGIALSDARPPEPRGTSSSTGRHRTGCRSSRSVPVRTHKSCSPGAPSATKPVTGASSAA